MSGKAAPSDLPIYSFKDNNEFEDFLEREHQTASGFHLKLAKKSSGVPSISASEAIEVALCFGWIDGRANGLDDKFWLVRYTPRRPKSIWSQKNVNTVAKLVEQGRMRPAGTAAVVAAKADGRWERAYAGPATITVPDDLATAFAANSAASTFFESLNKSDRYSVLWRVQTASPTARAGRIETLVQMLADGKKPGVAAKVAAAKTTRDVREKKSKLRKSAVSNKQAQEQSEELSKPFNASESHATPRRSGLRNRT